MPWLRICLALALLPTMILSLHSMLVPDDIHWEGTMSSEYEDTALPDILAVVGGVPELKAEVVFVMTEASSLRNGISTSKSVHLEVGGHAIVAKICFDDGICWAAKMYENRPGIYNRAIDY